MEGASVILVEEPRQPHTLVLVEDGATFALLRDLVQGMDVRECAVLGDVGFAFFTPADATVVIHRLRREGITFHVYMKVDV